MAQTVGKGCGRRVRLGVGVAAGRRARRRALKGLAGPAGAAMLALTLMGCDGLTRQEREIAGGLAGAALGVVGAEMLDADRGWTVLAALAGAAVGTMVARNRSTGECAYARADGTFRIAPCP
jgi:osmotically inducible lipoprotein OsmB